MHPVELGRLLEEVATGALSPEQATRRLSSGRLEFAHLDLDREQRTGLPEAVYAEGKSDSELAAIVDELMASHGRVLVTRIAADRVAALESRHLGARYHPRSRLFTAGAPRQLPAAGQLTPIAVISAGTADLAVAEEAAVVARWHGIEVERYDDVGVAGVHRLLERLEEIRRAPVVIVVAGMDGALPSVVAGLVAGAVIAVPTSVGYGASFSGLAALLTMLNSCAPGVAVVNIDSGYGAAVCASRILRSAISADPPPRR